jgi:tight adherence protein C
VDTLLAHPLTVQVAVFAAIGSAAVLVMRLCHRRDARIRGRIQELTAAGAKARKPVLRPSLLEEALLRPELPGLARHLLPAGEDGRLKVQTRLVRAGVDHPQATFLFFLLRLLAMIAPMLVAIVVAIAGAVAWNWALLYGSVGGGVGMLLPGLWLDRRIARRQHVLRRSLPDFLDLFVACVESGQALQATIGQVADELRLTHPELSAEFSVCSRQTQLGCTMEKAVADLAERTGLEELRSLSTFVQQSQRFGSTIGSALRELSDTLRTNRELRAEELAQQASVKILFPTLLFIFPAVFVVLAAPAAIRIHETLVQPAQDTRAPE